MRQGLPIARRAVTKRSFDAIPHIIEEVW